MPRVDFDKLMGWAGGSSDALYHCGVYMIVNTLNGKFYIGSTAKSFRERLSGHINALEAGKHHNRHFQSAYEKYGWNRFQVAILEICRTSRECLLMEQIYLDSLRPWEQSRGYNLTPTAGSMLGFKMPEEAKQKLSLANLGKSPSLEVRAKLSAALKGRKSGPRSEQIRQKISNSLKGRVRPLEEIAKAAASLKGHFVSDETRLKISLSTKGKKRSEEYRRRRSLEMLGTKRGPYKKRGVA